MATQTDRLAANSRPEEAYPNWRSYHIFRVSDQDGLLRTLVRPLIAGLAAAGVIDRFFFVRYDVGGPHVRLRWRLTDPRAADDAEAALAQRVSDPWTPVSVEFEVERYGGTERLPASLDLFHCSSVHMLGLFAGHEDGETAWIRSAMLRLMLHLAWGFAGEDERSFFDLVRYGERFMGGRFPGSAAQSDAVFEDRGPQLVRLARLELERLSMRAGSALGGDDLAVNACRLAVLRDGLAADAWWYLAASHIHMTANRLGLTNAEEVYLSRLLWRAVDTFRRQAPEAWADIRGRASGFVEQACRRSLTQGARTALAAVRNSV